MEPTEGTTDRVARDVVALTALPARWPGVSPERIADDVAATLAHLCAGLELVHVRIDLPPSGGASASRPVGRRPVPRSAEAGAYVRAANEAVVPVGRFGHHGEIVLVASPGEDLAHARLLAAIAANEIEGACRALDLERDVAQAHAKVAMLGKLGALGQLVGGVAHELRTPLTYASNYLHLVERDVLRRYPDAADDVAPKLAEVREALARINAIVGQLRRFARQEATFSIEEDLRDLVRDALRLWRATHAGGTRVAEALAPTPPVLADRGQLQQVVLNLVQNAHEAAGPQGEIVVETHDAGRHAVLVVQDDGPGMSSEVRAGLFQPFRTTKPDGLGLGLSIVRGIVEAHRGTVHVETAPGEGTRVVVRVPRA